MITVADIKDAEEINALVNSAYRGELSKKGWTTEADLLDGVRTTPEGLNETLSNPAIIFLKYVEHGQIKACVLLENQKEALYLGMLTVSPLLQGGGIGKKLLKAAEEKAKEYGLPKISMTVISIRAELIAWYERKGYKSTGEIKPFPKEDISFGLPKQHLEFIVMEKAIK